MSPLPILLFLSILFASSSEGFLFGSAGGGGCSCPQPVCQPSFPACPSPISGPIGGGGQPLIVNCGGKDGGGYGCGGGRIHGGGGMREEKVINVVLVPEQQKGPYHGADGRSGCVGGPANKGEDGRGCDAGQQAIQVVLDGEHGGEHHPAPAPQPPRGPIGECPESGGPCDFVIEHGKEESYAAQPQQQYASASGGGGYASPQQPSNGAPQQQGQNAAGYAQQGNGGYAPQAPPSGGYAPQAPPSEGYSPQQQQQAQSEYNANQPPVQQPVESDQRQPVSASEQGFPSPALSNVPAVQSYQPPTSEVQPAASESEAGYGPSGNAAAAAAGDRLQEVQDAAESGGTQETDNGATISSPSSTAPSTTTVTPIVANLRTDTNNQQQQVAVKQQQKMSDEQHDVFIEPVDVNLLKLTNDTECNSEELRAIIRENLSYELNTAKRQIQLQAEARFGGRFDVICSHHDFSYITNTELWCQETRESTSCYAYRQLGY